MHAHSATMRLLSSLVLYFLVNNMKRFHKKKTEKTRRFKTWILHLLMLLVLVRLSYIEKLFANKTIARSITGITRIGTHSTIASTFAARTAADYSFRAEILNDVTVNRLLNHCCSYNRYRCKKSHQKNQTNISIDLIHLSCLLCNAWKVSCCL